jgi:ATP-dependent RNA helicase DbpA
MVPELNSIALSPALLSVMQELGFETLTPIQAESIPVLLAGRDLVGQSRTGSGKTAAFGLPILQKLNLEKREIGAMVLCPTRELSLQVARELRKFGRGIAGLTVVTLTGGEPVRAQTIALENGAHIVVGTPGRVIDHLQRRTLRVHRVGTVVLDEADRMLDMGFLEDIEKILKALPKPRQTVFFSATFPSSFEALSKKHQLDPVRINATADGEEQADIRQLVMRLDPGQKLKAVRWVLENNAFESALVFANQKITIAELVQALSDAGLSVDTLHGDLLQPERERVMAKFRNGSTRVLVATDVAARGIDIQQLELVVNFDLPWEAEIYVHRIGRTGRAGKKGLAISFCTQDDLEILASIEQTVGITLEPLALPKETRVKGADAQAPEGAKMDTLRISGGRKDKLRPGDILGALTGEGCGLQGTDIGKIEIQDNCSYVAVSKTMSKVAQQGLSAGRIKRMRFKVDFVQ